MLKVLRSKFLTPKNTRKGGSGKNPEAEEETKDPSKEHSPEVEVKNIDPLETKNPETETKTSDPREKQDSIVTPGKAGKQIGEPIASITPLHSTQGNI